MKTTKKLMALLLSAIMIVTFMPAMAFAEGEEVGGQGDNPSYNANHFKVEYDNCWNEEKTPEPGPDAKVEYSKDGTNWIIANPFDFEQNKPFYEYSKKETIYFRMEQPGDCAEGYPVVEIEERFGPEENEVFIYRSDFNKEDHYYIEIDQSNLFSFTPSSDYEVSVRVWWWPEEDPAMIKIGDVTLVDQDGNLTEDASLIEGIVVSKRDERDFNIELSGLDKPSDNLKVNIGDGRAWFTVSGINNLKGIWLGEDTNAEIDSNIGRGVNTARINLSEGLIGHENMSGTVRFLNDVILKIADGSKEDGVIETDEGVIRNIREVKFENYNFHNREDVTNVEISSNRIFENIETVIVSSAKVDFNGHPENIIWAGDSDKAGTILLTAEGELSKHNLQINGKIENKYFHKYPGDLSDQGSISLADIYDNPEYTTTEEVELDLSGDGTEGKDPVEKDHYRYEYNADASWVCIQSKDPILYAISYVVDAESLSECPNADKGTVKLGGFERGFYIKDKGSSNEGFSAWIAEGESVDVTIMPQQGYQYKKNTLNINGLNNKCTTEASQDEAAIGQYSFEMLGCAGHMCADFEATPDIVETETSFLESANIANTSGSIQNGNAKMTISSENVTDTEEAQLQAEASEGAVLADVLDINLFESVIKNYDPEATTNTSWDTQLHDLDNNAVEISLTIDGAGVNDDYEVVREHDGAIERLDSTYDATTNTLTFDSDLFSTYAVFKTTKEKQPTPQPTKDDDVNVNPSGNVVANLGGDTKVAGNTASAVISNDTAKKIAEAAAKSGTTEIKLDATVNESVNKTELEIPMAIADAADNNGASVEIATNVGSVVLDAKTIKGIAKTDADSFTVTVEKAAESTDTKTVFNITLTSVKDGKSTTISKLQGTAQVVAPLPSGLKAEEACGLYMNGKLAEKVTTKVEGKNVVLTIKHFSTYGVMSNADADKLFKKSAQATTMGKLTLKTYKGGKIKASWKNGKGNTANITKYQVCYKQSGKKAKYTTTNSKSKTIKKLKKGKTYTVKTRAYIKINGKTYKSKWSSAKSIKCK